MKKSVVFGLITLVVLIFGFMLFNSVRIINGTRGTLGDSTEESPSVPRVPLILSG